MEKLLKRPKPGGRRIAANRANALKSTGPRTPEGKAVSSMNATRHGLCAATFVISNENLAEFEDQRHSYMFRLGPRDHVESHLIDRMVRAAWNFNRACTTENETINLQLLRMEAQIAREFNKLPESARVAAAFDELAKKPALSLLHRYQARMAGEYQRALKTLLELRKSVPLVPPGTPLLPAPETERHSNLELPNEPIETAKVE